MNIITIKFIRKVFVLSILFIIVFILWDNYLNANSNSNKNITTNTKINNSNLYKSQNNNNFGRIWVAISTNLWTSYSQINKMPATIYKEVFSVSDLIKNKRTKDELIWSHMLIIKDYLNLLKTDIKSLINNSYNKTEILNAFIEQLEFRYQNWLENEKNLLKQIEIFTNSMNSSESKIQILKSKIENDFKNNDSKASLVNIDEYLKLKQDYYYARTYIIYINHFVTQYNFLNNYSRILIHLQFILT